MKNKEFKFTNRDIYFFKKAKMMAEHSKIAKIRVRIGCVAVYNNNIISVGCNGNKTHPLQLEYNKYRKYNFPTESQKTEPVPKIHAEIDCLSHIIDSDIKWNKVKLYVYRLCKSREHGLALPCEACMKLIQDLGIRHVYFTTDYGYAYQYINN